MRIHLVTPRNPPSFWTYDHILPALGKRCMFPNLSMPTVAGLTPGEHEVTLCDENVEEVDFDVDADIVGITGYIIHRERMFEIVDAFRAPGQASWWSAGPTRRSARRSCAAAATCSSSTRPRRPGRSSCATTPPAPGRPSTVPAEKPDLTTAPTPRFDLLKVDRYHALTIQFARGCPFNCEFCDIIVVYGRRPRVKSVPQVMAEIEECHRLGARQVFLVDDNFIGNKKLAKELLRAIAAWSEERGHPMYFNTEVTLNVAQDDELLALLRAAHFTTIFIGIESPRKASLAETQKTQNLRGDLVGERAQDPVVRHPGAGRHDRRLRPRRRDHLRGAAALHPGRAHPGLDDRHAAGDAEDAAARAHHRRGQAGRRVERRSVRVLEHPAAQDDAPRAVPRIPGAGRPSSTTSASSGVGRWISCSARAPSSGAPPPSAAPSWRCSPGSCGAR